MRKRMFGDHQVANLLRDVERLIDTGSSVTLACRQIGISQQSYYRWRKEQSRLPIVDASERIDVVQDRNLSQQHAVRPIPSE
ncbi:transposase [Afipia sp. TerB]